MDKWKYKTSFISGILFIITFFFKELVVNSPEEVLPLYIVISFVFMVIYALGLFLGFVKYAILNENIFLKISTIAMMVGYSLIVIVELVDRLINFSSTLPLLVIVPKLLLGLSLVIFAIALLIQKRIYGKSTILQWISSFILGVSFLLPHLYLLQLPFFLIYFISMTYLVNKKIKEEKYSGRLL